MIEPTTRTNIVAFQNLTQMKWSCYSHTVPISSLGTESTLFLAPPSQPPNINTECGQLRPNDLILECHSALLSSGIPSLLSIERSVTNPEGCTLGLFVFWTCEPLELVTKLRQMREVRSGMITSDMLRNVSASDMDALFSGDDSKELVTLSVPLQATSFLLSTPNRRDLSEMELFLLAVRNLLTRKLVSQGNIPLGRLYLSSHNPIAKYDGLDESSTDNFSMTFDMWLSSSTLYLRTKLTSHQYVSVVKAQRVPEVGTSVLLSPHASSGLFMGFVQEMDSSKETELVDIWAKKVGVTPEDLFPDLKYPWNMGCKPCPRFCSIQALDSNYTLIYPTCFVFLPRLRPNLVKSSQPERELSVLGALSAMMGDVTVSPTEPEPSKSRRPEVKIPEIIEPSEPEYTPVIDSARTGELDKWLYSLAQTQPRLGIDELHNGDFTSPAHPLPGLTPGHLNGTDPTPPTDSEFGADPELLGASMDFGFNNDTFITDFGMEDFDSFQINDSDFSYFDRVETKVIAQAPGLIDTPISLPEPTTSGQQIDPSPSCHEPNPVEILPPKASLKRPRDEVKALITSHNPWVPKNFQPISGLSISNAFLFRGKFSVLSKELSECVPKPAPKATYSVKYRPTKRRRLMPCPPPVTVPASSHHLETPIQVVSSSDSSSDSEDSCSDVETSPIEESPNTMTFIAPDIALSWPSQSRSVNTPPQPEVSIAPPWKDPAILRLFMDQLRTYPLASCASVAPQTKTSSFKLWRHIVSLSRSLLSVFKRPEMIGGPLTLQECCQSSLSNNPRREAQDLAPPITWAPPAKIQAYISPTRLAEVCISSVSFWKDLGLRPVSGQRDVSYLCFFPLEKHRSEEISGLVGAIRDSYEASHLGKLTPMALKRVDNGLCAISTGLKGYVSAVDNMAKASSLLGAELSRLPPANLPKNILLLYSPPESSSPSQAIWDAATCFHKLQSQISNSAIGSRVQFQILPAQTVAQYHAQRLPLSFIPSMGLNIYSKLDPTNYNPAFTLSRPPPTQVQFRMPHNQDPLFDYSETLHLSYSYGPAKSNLVAVWMDGRAQIIDHCLLPVPALAFSDDNFLVNNLWQATLRFQARSFKGNARIVVTKIGAMEAGELDAWRSTIAHIPGSCILSAGINNDLELFEPSHAGVVDPSRNTAVVVLSDLHLPHAKNVVSRAVGILRADLPSSQWVQVVLLADTFHIASPPLPLALSFRRVLSQLQDLAALDAALRVSVLNPLDPTVPRSTHPAPAFPLPWRWIQDTCSHLQTLQSSPV